MNTIDDFLNAVQCAELTWMPAKYGHAMYESIYKGEPVKMRLNDFPSEVAFTLFVRGQEIDLEEFPKSWHFAPEE